MIEFDVTSARTRPLEPRVGMAYPICRAPASADEIDRQIAPSNFGPRQASL